MSSLTRPDPALGVFETLLVVRGAPVELEAHLDRLGASVVELYGTELSAQARELVRQGAVAHERGRLRLNAIPADGQLTLDTVSAAVDPATVFPSWELAITLQPFLAEGGLGRHKWADRHELAKLEASVGAGSLPLLMDSGEEALEASRANLFAVEGDVLVTPPADDRILSGVARMRVLEAAGSLGIEAIEEPLTLARLEAAGEAFLTGSVRGVEPVGAVGGRQLRPPGTLVGKLVAHLRGAWIGSESAERTPA